MGRSHCCRVSGRSIGALSYAMLSARDTFFYGGPLFAKRSKISGSIFIPRIAGRLLRFPTVLLHWSIQRRQESELSRRLAGSLRDFCSLFSRSVREAAFFLFKGRKTGQGPLSACLGALRVSAAAIASFLRKNCGNISPRVSMAAVSFSGRATRCLCVTPTPASWLRCAFVSRGSSGCGRSRRRAPAPHSAVVCLTGKGL